jgi:hypothetical protein
MYQQGNAAATTTGTAGVWYQIANFGAGTLSGATFGTNGIAVTNAGTYQISGSFDGTVTDNSDAVAFSIAVNGTAGGLLPKNNLYRALVPNQTAVRFSGAVNGYLVLAANDVVKLIGTCTNAAHNFTVANANVTLSSP